MNAAPRAIEAKAVVRALDLVTNALALRERDVPMGAAVLQGGESAVAATEDHDRAAEDLACDETVAELVRPARDVPAVFQERHGFLPQARTAAAAFSDATWSRGG